MGQYYNILTMKNNRYKVYDRSYYNTQRQKEYMMAKLTEHSWIGNSTMESFSNIIFRNPQKIAWVGDYADDTKKYEITNKELTLKKIKALRKIAHKSNKEITMEYRPLNTKYMLLVNWTKNQYIDMYEYIEKNSKDGWCLHPLSLLTALGNGKGGGDYYGINKDMIGTWAFDKISFESADLLNKLEQLGFTKMEYEFNE